MRAVVAAFLAIVLAATSASLATESSRGESASSPQVEPDVLSDLKTDGTAVFWIVFREEADLRPAYRIHDWGERGRFVVRQSYEVAARSQARVRAVLDSRGIAYKPFWIINAIRVSDGTQDLLDAVSGFPEVKAILAPRVYQLSAPNPPPCDGFCPADPPELSYAATAAEEVDPWGVRAIRAPQVWSTFNARGGGITVANIDTGVRWEHDALKPRYRGWNGTSATHDHNWYDPSQECSTGTPCDTDVGIGAGHGTHTMGTMVGAPQQIGVAPHARWIAAVGCSRLRGCADDLVLAAGQWMLAPTDQSGANPRADLRPNIVNNSWGSSLDDPFYQSIVTKWSAAQIFSVFSNGNVEQPRPPLPPVPAECGSAESPGEYPESFAAGFFKQNSDGSFSIDERSKLGPSAYGVVKPDIAAPGTGIWSSGNSSNADYVRMDGSSMAAPHVAGTVALMWSAAPWLPGNVSRTRDLLAQSAVDVAQFRTDCGGTPQNNNTWGQGRLDAYEAVRAAQAPGAVGDPNSVVAQRAQRARGDFNGDGRSDIAMLIQPAEGGSALYVGLSTGNGFDYPQVWWANPWWGWDGIKLAAGDFNGDGRSDIAMLIRPIEGGSALYVGLSTGNGFDYPALWWANTAWGWDGIKLAPGDFNADGLADMAMLVAPAEGGSALYVGVSLGGGFYYPELWWANTTWNWNGIKLAAADYNGDAVTDIAMLITPAEGGSALYVGLSSGAGFGYPTVWWANGTWGWDGIKLASGDFNADGRADIAMLIRMENGWSAAYVGLSTGAGFTYPAVWWANNTWGWNGIKLAPGDFNGDRRADLAMLIMPAEGGSAIYVGLSTGTGFGYPGVWWANPWWGWAGIKLA